MVGRSPGEVEKKSVSKSSRSGFAIVSLTCDFDMVPYNWGTVCPVRLLDSLCSLIMVV